MQLLPVSVAAALLTSPPDLGQALCKSLHLSGELWRGTTWLRNRWEEPGAQTVPANPLLSSSSKHRQTFTPMHNTGLSPPVLLLTTCSPWYPRARLNHFEANNLYFSAENRLGWNKSLPFSRQSLDLMAAVSSWVIALLCLLPEMRLGEQLSLDYGKAFSSLFCLI